MSLVPTPHSKYLESPDLVRVARVFYFQAIPLLDAVRLLEMKLVIHVLKVCS